MAADGNFSNRPPKFGGFQGVAFSACSHTHDIAHENVSVSVLKKGGGGVSDSFKNFPRFARVFEGKFNWKSLSLLNRNRISPELSDRISRQIDKLNNQRSVGFRPFATNEIDNFRSRVDCEDDHHRRHLKRTSTMTTTIKIEGGEVLWGWKISNSIPH